MARFLVLWRRALTAPSVVDPVERQKFIGNIMKDVEDLVEKGEVEEFGVFPEGTAGLIIAEGEATDIFNIASILRPYYETEVHEIIPMKKIKEILVSLLKARAEAAKK